MNTGSLGGSLITIPSNDGVGLAKVVFRSEYFAEAILLKLFKKRIMDASAVTPGKFSGPYDLYYTSLEGLKKKRWAIVATEPVSEDEKELTRRTSGGEVWVEDNHLGTATDADLATLPKMLSHGFKLIEKYVGRYPIAAKE